MFHFSAFKFLQAQPDDLENQVKVCYILAILTEDMISHSKLINIFLFVTPIFKVLSFLQVQISEIQNLKYMNLRSFHLHFEFVFFKLNYRSTTTSSQLVNRSCEV